MLSATVPALLRLNWGSITRFASVVSPHSLCDVSNKSKENEKNRSTCSSRLTCLGILVGTSVMVTIAEAQETRLEYLYIIKSESQFKT